MRNTGDGVTLGCWACDAGTAWRRVVGKPGITQVMLFASCSALEALENIFILASEKQVYRTMVRRGACGAMPVVENPSSYAL
jgi:hypothetical protein